MTDITLDVAGETLRLLPERAVFWERTGTLFITDPHIGKAATFRAHRIALPEGDTSADLARLTSALFRTEASRLVILGDLLHHSKGRDTNTLATFAAWRAQHADLPILLVRGNHDARAGDPPADWRIDCADEPTLEAPFALAHYPFAPESGYALAGHLHPAALLVGKGRQSLKLPCFWFGQRCAVLPAFGSFIDHTIVQPATGDRVFVTSGAQVIRV